MLAGKEVPSSPQLASQPPAGHIRQKALRSEEFYHLSITIYTRYSPLIHLAVDPLEGYH